MVKYHLTRKAVQDLDTIWDYTLKTWSERKADEYYSSLVTTFAEIAKRVRRDSFRSLSQKLT